MSEPQPDVAAPESVAKPKLVFFYSPQSGRCRRVEGFMAQVLQRRQNRETFEPVQADHRPARLQGAGTGARFVVAVRVAP